MELGLCRARLYRAGQLIIKFVQEFAEENSNPDTDLLVMSLGILDWVIDDLSRVEMSGKGIGEENIEDIPF